MVEVIVREKNQIINLIVEGKAPIRGRISSSPFFHSPLELLLSALGLCIGGKINDYCRVYEINPSIFERILIDYDGIVFKVLVKRPANFEQEHIFRIADEITNCTIAKELKKQIAFDWEINDTPVEELIRKPTQKCCGSK